MKKLFSKIKNAIRFPFEMIAILKEESQNIDENGDWGERGKK